MDPPVSSPSDRGAEERARGRSRAAAGAAGVGVQVPRVARGAVTVGEAGDGEFREVGLPQQHRPRLLEVGDHRGVFPGDEIGQNAGPAGAPHPRRVELVLDGHRYAVERPSVVPRRDFLLCLPGGRHGQLSRDGQIGIELEVQVVNAVKVGFCGFYGGHLFGLNQTGEIAGGEEGQVGFVHDSSVHE